MKLSTCVSLLLVTVFCLAKADTNYFEKPVEGSKFPMCTKVEFLLDRVGNDDDKVILAKLFKEEKVNPAPAPAPAPGPSNPKSTMDPDGNKKTGQGDGRKDPVEGQGRNVGVAPISDEQQHSSKTAGAKPDVDPNVKSTFISLLRTWKGAELNDVSDINFFWVIPTNLIPGDYHVAMEITRIDELNQPPEPGRDAGDISDPVRSYTFTILPPPANKTLCEKM